MSKEMEALKTLRQGSFDSYHSTSFEDIYHKEFEILNQALTPPTEQEVCDALGEYLDQPVWIDNNFIRISTQCLVKPVYYGSKYKGLDIQVVLPPHLITMISRFYEGRMNDE